MYALINGTMAYPMEFHIQSASIAHGLALGVPAP